MLKCWLAFETLRIDSFQTINSAFTMSLSRKHKIAKTYARVDDIRKMNAKNLCGTAIMDRL